MNLFCYSCWRYYKINIFVINIIRQGIHTSTSIGSSFVHFEMNGFTVSCLLGLGSVSDLVLYVVLETFNLIVENWLYI